ncbi:MAG: UTP--glucose-1-phosphate uridylyltransferase [Myxococcota bacterium]|nr:UTP--glucose-1-phosphate uridylyltransferase [Myxococcota bacterium]
MSLTKLPADVRQTIHQSGLDPDEIEALRHAFVGADDLSAANQIEGTLRAPRADELHRGHDTAVDLSRIGLEELRRGAVGLIILNGGMATRFGGHVKGAVTVSDGLSFLGFKLKDALRVSRRAAATPPIVILMNSNATDAATKAHLAAHEYFGYPQERIWMMTQCWSVRFNLDGSIVRNDDGQPEYYGPGHGDVVTCLKNSGCLARFIAEGGERFLLSNVDNVVATLDTGLIGLHVHCDKPLMIEVVDRWNGDTGGAPLWVNHHAQIVEGFRLPPDFSIETVPYFNTNTFWIHVDAFDVSEKLTWFCVKKSQAGRTFIQFERLVGELSAHVGSAFAHVPRDGLGSRFIPVKTPDDLAQNRAWVIEAWEARGQVSDG